eukprot:g2341.t1
MLKTSDDTGSGGEGGGGAVAVDDDDRRVISIGVLSFVLISLGHSWKSRLLGTLKNLQAEPPLLEFAPFQHAYRKNSVLSCGMVEPTIPANKIRRIAKSIRGHYLFANMTATQLVHFSKKFRQANQKLGKHVYEQDDVGNGKFYVILSGTVAVCRNGTQIRMLSAGDTFGDVALLYRCPRRNTMTCIGSDDGDIVELWALESTEFAKVKKNRFVFKYKAIQNVVYRRILSGHRKTLHSLVASFLMDQRRRRLLLRKKFTKGVASMKTALGWSRMISRANTQTLAENMPAAVSEKTEEGDTNEDGTKGGDEETPAASFAPPATLGPSSKIEDRREQMRKVHRGSKNYEAESSRLKKLVLAHRVVSKVPKPKKSSAIRKVRMSVFSTLNSFQKRWKERRGRAMSRLQSVTSSFLKDIESAGESLSVEEAESLAMSHVGGLDRNIRIMEEIYTADDDIELDEAIREATAHENLDDDGDEFNNGDEFDDDEFERATAEMLESESRIRTVDGDLVLRESKTRQSRLNESFQGAGGLAISMCNHLLVSRMDAGLVLGQVQSTIDAISKKRDSRMVAMWYNRVIGRLLALDCVPLVMRHFVRTGSIEFENDSAVTWQVDRVTTNALRGKDFCIHPIVSKIRSQICDAANLRRAAMLRHRQSVAGRNMNAMILSKGSMQAHARRALDDLSASLKIAQFLRILASSYQDLRLNVLAHNTAQVGLLYLSLPTVGADADPVRASFAPFAACFKGTTSTKQKSTNSRKEKCEELRDIFDGCNERVSERGEILSYVMAARVLYDLLSAVSPESDAVADANALRAVTNEKLRELS